jgi:hypothetical protein
MLALSSRLSMTQRTQSPMRLASLKGPPLDLYCRVYPAPLDTHYALTARFVSAVIRTPDASCNNSPSYKR